MTYQTLVEEIFKKPTQTISRTEMEKGASSRRYYRLEFDATPNTMVQMVLPKDAMKSDEASGEMKFEELPFVNMQRHMERVGLPVPKIYLDATSRGSVFIEDLGPTTFNQNLKGKSETEVEQWYNAAIDLLAQMHNQMWPLHTQCYAGMRSFDYELLRWELEHYREWGLQHRLGQTTASSSREQLDTVFDDFAKEIDALPKGFVHRDYQSRNLMVRQDNPSPQNLYIIDFQDALIGPRSYDLVALLNDSYVDLSQALQSRLVRRYAQHRNLSYEEIQKEFDIITIQRKLKDGGRFVFIDQVKGDPSFLPFVSKSFSRVKNALARIKGYHNLKNALKAVDPDAFA